MLHIGSKRMAAGSGGGKNDKLMMIGLGAVIVVALGGLVWSLMGSGSGDVTLPDGLKFHCSKCGHEWFVDKSDLGKFSSREVGFGGPTPNCPSCGGDRSGAQMSFCPSCKGWYMQKDRNSPICGLCGADIAKFYAEQAKQ